MCGLNDMADEKLGYRGMFLYVRCCGGWWVYTQFYISFYRLALKEYAIDRSISLLSVNILFIMLTTKPTGGEANDIL